MLTVEEALGIHRAFVPPSWEGLVLGEVSTTVDAAAIHLQEYWKLGLAPIADVTGLLLSKGIRVVEVDVDITFESLSAWIDGRFPLIAVNAAAHVDTESLNALERSTTLIEALAHLILPFAPGTSEKVEEKICARFAATLLLPPAGLIEKEDIVIWESEALGRRYRELLVARAQREEVMSENRTCGILGLSLEMR